MARLIATLMAIADSSTTTATAILPADQLTPRCATEKPSMSPPVTMLDSPLTPICMLLTCSTTG